MYPSPQNFVFDNDVLLLVMYYSNMIIKTVVLILYSVQRYLNHHFDLSDSSRRPLYSLVCDIPRIGPVMASTALY